MEIIIPILTSLGAILGVTKKFLDLHGASRNLKVNNRIDFYRKLKLGNKAKGSLDDAYAVLVYGGEITAKILHRVRWHYIMIFGICFIFFIVTSYSAVLIAVNLSNNSLIIFAFLAFAITIASFHFLLKNPIKFVTKGNKPDLQKINDFLEKATNIENVISEVRRTVSTIDNSLTLVQERIGISWLSNSEEKFLKEYNKLCAIVDTIEAYFIRIRLKTVETDLYENLNKEIKGAIIQIFESMVEKKILTTKPDDNEKEWKEMQEKNIKKEFEKSGLQGMLQVVSRSFYEIDFTKSEYPDNISGINKLVTKNFPFN